MDCEICGERIKMRGAMYLDEVGEFWDADNDTSLIAHADCGLSANLELA